MCLLYMPMHATCYTTSVLDLGLRVGTDLRYNLPIAVAIACHAGLIPAISLCTSLKISDRSTNIKVIHKG